MSDFAIDQYTTWPPLQLNLTNNGAAVDLTMAESVTLILQNALDGTVTLVGAMRVLNAPQGLVQYQWDTDDTLSHGNFEAKVQVAWAGGGVQNFPRSRSLWIEIDAAPLVDGLPVTDGGDDSMFTSSSVLLTALGATPVAVSTTPGALAGFQLTNNNTADIWLQVFDAAVGSVTVGTTTPKQTFRVPGGGTADPDFDPPVSYATAITVAATTTPTGATGPAVPLVGNVEVLS